MTRKGSKQLTDEERSSQVASPTSVASPTRAPSPRIPPGKMDGTIMRDPEILTAIERKSPSFWTPEILQGVKDAQKKHAKMTVEERAIAYEKTRLSMGMLPIATMREMRENDRKRAERAKQRGNTSCPSGNDNNAAVPGPFEIDNDTDEMTMTTTTTTGKTTSSLKTATTTRVGTETPITKTTPMTTTTPMMTATPTTITLSQLMMRRQRIRTAVK